MKGLICVLILTLSNISLSQYYPHLFELRGLEDSLRNTHLFYRYRPQTSGCWSKNIYHLDISSNIDTIYIRDDGYIVYPEGSCEGIYVYDYEFFDNDPTKFIYCGYDLWIDPVAELVRYDVDIQIEAFVLTEIEISVQDENLVYVSAGPGFFKSTDGGYNFEFNDSMQTVDVSIISLSKNNDSQIYGINDNKLLRSEDDGNSYTIIDDSYWSESADLFYDSDVVHIYGLSVSYSYQTRSHTSNIYISNDNGNPFTWLNTIIHNVPIRFTLDNLQSGEVYYSLQKDIYKSTDYANSFEFYKRLDRNVTGLYKKSGSNILYAATPLNIYEITPDTIQVIKSIPIPNEIFKYYPLAVGNKWIYSQTARDFWSGNVTSTYFIREVTGDTIMSNNQMYKRLIEYDAYVNTEFIFYERIDSSSGLVYRYTVDSTHSNNEFLLEDLLSEIGDTITSYRLSHYSPWSSNQIIHSKDNIFNDFNLTRDRKVYSEPSYLHLVRQSLTKGIGLDSLIIDLLDWYTSFVDLKGCIIDGIVYGDTTVVSVEDEPQRPFTFSLSQNYPNPFNPVTKIRYTVGGYPPSIYTANILPPAFDYSVVKLIVYDILGNEIATLVNEEKYPGNYEVEFDGGNLSSGIYFYRLRAGGFSDTKKFILLK